MNRSRLIVVASILIPLLWLFGPALFSSRSFVFRDAAHYYYPLFEWSAGEWSAGRVPLWNPQENCGVPVLADTTSSVVYPGKLIFALPLSFPARYKIYIVSHVLLAAAAAYLLARRWQASPVAAGICGLSYAFGGNVVFQYCNVVFLVGAAWLPWALLATDRMLNARSLRWAVALGAVLAIMTLGGDPQTAYHAGLLAALYALLLWGEQRRASKSVSGSAGAVDRAAPAVPGTRRGLSHRFTLLVVAAVSGALLAAVQILPAIEWTRHSDRAAYDAPRNLYEVTEYLQRPSKVARLESSKGVGAAGGQIMPVEDSGGATLSTNSQTGVWSGLFGAPQAGVHHEHIYHFSIGPWRLAELIWPNVSGRMFPTQRRWLNVIPAEGGVWTPSLYMGLLPLLLALGSWRLRGGDVRQRWLSWSVLLAALGSLGWYGIGWLIQETRFGLSGAEPQDVLIGQPVGGLYWLMVVTLPGYAYFRFPAKLLVVAALGLSLLAAKGFDRALADPPKRLRYTLAAIAVVSMFGVAIALAVRPFWSQWMQSVEPDEIFGPLDATGAANDLLFALLHTAVLCGLYWRLFGRVVNTPDGTRGDEISFNGEPKATALPGHCRLRLAVKRFIFGPVTSAKTTRSHVALLIAAIDLAVAHGWLVPTAPQQIWSEPPQLARVIAEEDWQHATPHPYRVFRAAHDHWLPEHWSRTSSTDRQVEGLRWDHDTLFPKYHLATNVSLVESYSTIMSQDYRWFLRVARQHGLHTPNRTAQPHPAVLDALSAKYLILPDEIDYPGATRIVGWTPSSVLRIRTDEGVHPTLVAAEARAKNEKPLKHVACWYNPSCLPRAWIVHQFETLPPLNSSAPADVERRTQQVLFPGGNIRELRSSAVVETDDASQLQIDLIDGNDLDRLTTRESCRVVVDQPQRVEIEATLGAPGLVVLNDLYFPGWTAEVMSANSKASPQHVQMLQTNRVMRGVYLPAGKHRIVYRYQPVRFYIGATISAITWSLLLIIGAYTCRRIYSGGHDHQPIRPPPE